MTIPGAPWHHCTRIEPSGSTRGRPVGERPSTIAARSSTPPTSRASSAGAPCRSAGGFPTAPWAAPSSRSSRVSEALRPESVRVPSSPTSSSALSRPGLCASAPRRSTRTSPPRRASLRVIPTRAPSPRCRRSRRTRSKRSVGELVAWCVGSHATTRTPALAAEQADFARRRLRLVVGVVRCAAATARARGAPRRRGRCRRLPGRGAAARRARTPRRCAGVEILDRRLGSARSRSSAGQRSSGSNAASEFATIARIASRTRSASHGSRSAARSLPGDRATAASPSRRDRGRAPRVEAVRGEERDADVAVEERVGPRPSSLELFERMDGEAASAVEPALVAGALEDLQERVAVAGGAMAETGALAVRARAPRELRACEEELLRRGTRPWSQRSRARRGTTARGVAVGLDEALALGRSASSRAPLDDGGALEHCGDRATGPRSG